MYPKSDNLGPENLKPERCGAPKMRPGLDFSSKSDFGSETNENLRKTKKNRPGGLPN